MPCVQCSRCHSSDVALSRWRPTLKDLWVAASFRRPYRCIACMHRFASWATTTEKTTRGQAKWRKATPALQTLGMVLACALLIVAPARADVVYTTASTKAGESSTNIQSPSLSSGYKVGTFGSSNTPSFSFTTTQSGTQLPGIQFTTATFSDTQTLTGININLFVTGGTGGANSINSGTMHWDLYQASARVGSFTSTLNALAWTPSGGAGSSVYQNNPVSLSSGSANLLSETQYTLLLTSIDGLTSSNSPNKAQLYWSFFNSAPAPADEQPYTLNNSGYVTGPYSGGDQFTQQNLAFDITTQAAPEPGTLLLGLIASSAGGGAVWWKRRKKPVPQTPEEESEANAPA